MKRFELPRHASRRLTFAERRRKLRGERVLELCFLLHPDDPRALDGARAAGQVVGRDALHRAIGPGKADARAFETWLSRAGLDLRRRACGGSLVYAEGTATRIEAALEVELGEYAFGDRRHFGCGENPTLPARLATVVRGIAGLNDLPGAHRPRPHRAPTAKVSGEPKGLRPEELLAAYGAAGAKETGRGVRLGIVELGGGFHASDLSRFATEFGLPTTPPKEIRLGGARNRPSEKGTASGEVALDVQWARATAPDAELQLYWARNSDQGWLDFLAALVDAPDDELPHVVSISWGFPEDAFASSRRHDQTRALFQHASLRGVTFFASTGDYGASDQPPGQAGAHGDRHADFPGVLPEVTAVGGTRLYRQKGEWREDVWNEGRAGATGGGFSRYLSVPRWQTKALRAHPGVVGRGVPDVAAMAAMSPGLALFFEGKWGIAAGTSVATPIWAGLVARLAEKRVAKTKTGLGNINPALYAAFDAGHGPCRDITRGDNDYDGVRGFTARRGWDAASGLGSPAYARLRALLG